jgi:hypothetical protein
MYPLFFCLFPFLFFSFFLGFRQSNMVYDLKSTFDPEQEIANADNYSRIRITTFPQQGWQVASAATVVGPNEPFSWFSGVCWYARTPSPTPPSSSLLTWTMLQVFWPHAGRRARPPRAHRPHLLQRRRHRGSGNKWRKKKREEEEEARRRINKKKNKT